MSAFKTKAKAAGFTEAMADFMERCLAKIPHDHTIDQIEGLQAELDSLELADDDDSDDEDDYE